MALDSPGVFGAGSDQCRERNAQQSAAHRCHRHGHPEVQRYGVEEQPAHPACHNHSRNQQRTIASAGNETSGVASAHLAYRNYGQGQGHEADAYIVGIYQEGREEADEGPVGDAVGHVNRQGRAEVRHGEQRPIPGENHQIPNPLAAVPWEPEPVREESRSQKYAGGHKRVSPSNPFGQQSHKRHTDCGGQQAEAQECADSLCPPFRRNDIGDCPYRVGRQSASPQAGQHSEGQEHFDVGREGRTNHGYEEQHQPGESHGASSKGIGQRSNGHHGESPSREGGSSQLACDCNGYFQVRCDLHQQRGDDKYGILSGKNGKGKNGKEPSFVYLLPFRLWNCGGDIIAPLPTSSALLS